MSGQLPCGAGVKLFFADWAPWLQLLLINIQSHYHQYKYKREQQYYWFFLNIEMNYNRIHQL